MDCGQSVSGAQKQAKSSGPVLNEGVTPGSGGHAGGELVPTAGSAERFRDRPAHWPPGPL